jgi:hypothetical protein
MTKVMIINGSAKTEKGNTSYLLKLELKLSFFILQIRKFFPVRVALNAGEKQSVNVSLKMICN